MSLFIAALLTVTKVQAQPKYPSLESGLQVCYIFVTEPHSATKHTGTMSLVSMSLNGEEALLSEISQAEKDKYSMVPLTREFSKSSLLRSREWHGSYQGLGKLGGGGAGTMDEQVPRSCPVGGVRSDVSCRAG